MFGGNSYKKNLKLSWNTKHTSLATKTDMNIYFEAVLSLHSLQSKVQSPDPNKSTNDKIAKAFNALSTNHVF